MGPRPPRKGQRDRALSGIGQGELAKEDSGCQLPRGMELVLPKLVAMLCMTVLLAEVFLHGPLSDNLSLSLCTVAGI